MINHLIAAATGFFGVFFVWAALILIWHGIKLFFGISDEPPKPTLKQLCQEQERLKRSVLEFEERLQRWDGR